METQLSSAKDEKWRTIRDILFKERGAEKPPDFILRLFTDKDYSMAKDPDRDIDYETGRLLDFEQLDGSWVHVSTRQEEGLTIIEEVTITDPRNPETPFKLSDFIPKGHTLIEGILPNCGGWHPSKVIILSPSFMGSVGGRVEALHEIAHAKDYSQHPLTKQELIQLFKGASSPPREEAAWQEARNLLKICSKKVLWLPKTFLENEFEAAVNYFLLTHRS